VRPRYRKGGIGNGTTGSLGSPVMRAWSLAALLLPGVLALAAACGSTDSGDDSGPAITLSLVPGGSVAVGAPTMTMALRDSDGAIANDLVRLSRGALPPQGNGGR
jgi:hypothetical protein